MDGTNPPSSPHDAAARIGSDAEPTAVDVRHLTDSPEPLGNVVVYYGDEKLVGQGFVIALRAMGIEADFPEGDTVLRPPNNREN